ncbi:MAG: HAD-IA family hydrolase [Acidimicrobiia bacterium]
MIRVVLFDVGGTLVEANPPGTAVADLVARPIGTAVQDLRALKARFRLGAVTDTSVMTAADVRAALTPSGLDDLLEVVVTSVDVGTAKPDPGGVLAALDRLGATPAEALFVGDADVDADAAQRAGVAFARVGPACGAGQAVHQWLAGARSSGGAND